jgi:hypothetical protein
LNFEKFDFEGNNLYVLLKERGKTADFEIVMVDVKGGAITSAGGKIPGNAAINDFKVINGYAYLGGRTMPTTGQILGRTCFIYGLFCIPVFFGAAEIKYQPVLVMTDVSSQKSLPIVLKYKGSAAVMDLSSDEKTRNAQAVISSRPDKKTTRMEIKEFAGNDISGNLPVYPKNKNELLTGRFMNLSGASDKLLIGTYSVPVENKSFGEKVSRALGKTAYIPNANGMYIAKFSGDEQEYIQYYPFSKFESFWKKIKSTQTSGSNKNNKKKKDVKESKVNYQLLVHNVIEKNNEYVMVAEAYYPEYHTEYYTTTDANGRVVTQSRTVFDGYRYTHAIVAGFNKDGEKIWDNSFEIWDILTYNLKERVRVLFEGDNIVLAYSNGGAIMSKVISGNQIVDRKQVTKIETAYSDDKVRSNWGSDMEFWYDNFFLTWGYQRIKSSEANKKKRNVFYFNKIAFQ